jgi:nucleoside-diphosphate-sugar epimerase
LDNKISILGCGWLGLPLATRLIANGWKVKGSTTSSDKVKLLSLNAIEAYLVQLHKILEVKHSNFWHSDVLFINVPPSLKKQSGISYLEQMQALARIVAASPIKKVIFISSTSVYPELNKIITSIDEVNESSALLQSEKLFTQNPAFKTTVIRFGGLIGPGRHPSRFFAGKKGIPNGQAPVNLIHLDDCLGIIQTVLNQQSWGEIYNGVWPQHPAKAEFYTRAAQQAGLEAPEFIDELKDWKIIDPQKTIHQLGYLFIGLIG